ncbi:FAD-dependent oxidoreductase [Acidithiobacillus sp. AMEEHan]|uniref:FAD-dependent oxidoreductase n=1 Tax=Acidithiobacillus sp. AMEEHan TaxID=2994951 RepID=UPI0027E3CDCA|nr:FAD-dependent oxidoreductase [Acidithiobacillus sp. AMEEHan]
MAEAYVIKMPQLSDTMTEGVLVSWEKKPGERVERGDVVATVETDKAIMDVEVFRSGYLAGPLVAVDSVIPVGEAIGYLVDSPEATVETPVADAGAPQAVAASAEQTPSASEDLGHVIKMPQLSDTMTEGVLVSWEKQLGDKIERGDVVATVETDKAIMDVEVFRAGYLSGPLVAVDSVVPVGEPIAYLVDSSEQVRSGTAVSADKGGASAKPAAPTAAAKTAAPVAVATSTQPSRQPGAQPAPRPQQGSASPYARQLAGERGMSLEGLRGSGPNGVIVAADVPAAQGGASSPAAASIPVPPPVPGEGRAMTAIEKAISQSMTASLSIPVFHVTIHVQPEALMRAAKAAGVSVTVALAKAASAALAKHPLINAAYQPGDRIVDDRPHDIGIAATTEDGGLVVPVLRNVAEQSLQDLQAAWKPLLEKARKRRLSPAEYQHPTFTISNMGMYGISQFDAIVTPGTAAILAIAATGPQGMPITITADHRVVNGAEAAAFLKDLQDAIEHPEAWAGSSGPVIPEGDFDTQVLVIGGGPGGEDCARELAEHGIKVTLVNNAPYPGGECLWRGCIPSKAWRAAADRIRDRAHDAAMGIGLGTPQLDWAQLEKHRRGILQTRGEMALKTDQGMKIEVLEGFARFIDPHTVEISGKNARTLSFGACVIATGAPAFVPPIPGAKEALAAGAAVTSDTVWELSTPPKRLCVIGAGAIGMEMAQMFHDFGAEVLVLEALPRPVAEMEKEVAEQLMAALAKNSPRLTVLTGVQTQEIRGEKGNLTLRYRDAEGQEHSHNADLLLIATGKRPDTSALQLEKAGVKLGERGAIATDARCQTNVPHIFAVGDVIGGYMLAHTAGQQGRVAAANLLGESARYDARKDSGVTFTRPQVAFVGISGEQAKAAGLDVAEVKVPLSIDAKAMMTGETDGLIKMVADKKTHRIVGVHFLADHADTLVGEAVLMVSAELTLEQVGSAIHPHPTQTELFGEMARRLLSRLRRSARNKQ